MPGMDMEENAASIPNSRCVLWLHPTEVVPKPLLRSLSRRIEKTVFATDAYEALAEVCSLINEGMREGKPHPVVLLFFKPARLTDADQVIHYLDMYAPRTRRWRFDPSANPVFGPMTEEDVTKLVRGAAAGGGGGRGGATANAGTGVFPAIVVPSRGGGGESAVAAAPARRSSRSTNRGNRPSPQPRLRLVETDPSAETVMGHAAIGGGGGGTNFSQLTPEELQMLLSDAPPPEAGGGPGAGSAGGGEPRGRRAT